MTTILDIINQYDIPHRFGTKPYDNSKLTREDYATLKGGQSVTIESDEGEQLTIRYGNKSMKNVYLANRWCQDPMIVCLDIDDLSITYEDALSRMRETFGQDLPHTRSTNKRMPHFYFILEGLSTPVREYQKVLKEIEADFIHYMYKNKNGFGHCVSMREFSDSPVYNYTGELPTIQWNDIKHIFKEGYGSVKATKRITVKAPKCIIDMEETPASSSTTNYYEGFNAGEVDAINKFLKDNGIDTLLTPFQRTVKDNGTIQVSYEASDVYQCPFCSREHRKNSNHPFIERNNHDIGFCCRSGQKKHQICKSVQEEFDLSDVYSSEWFLSTVERFNRQFIMLRNGDYVMFDHISPTKVEWEVIESANKMERILAPEHTTITVNAKPKKIKFFPTWSEWPERPLYKKVIYYPDNTRDFGNNVVNLWKGFRITEIPLKSSYTMEEEAKYQRYLEMESYWMDQLSYNNPHIKEFLYLRTASCIQQPSLITPVCIVLYSKPQGSGKSTLPKWIASLMGDAFFYQYTSKGITALTSTYTPPELQYTHILNIDEMDSMKPEDLAKFKSFVQDDYMEMNIKFIPQYKIQRFQQLFGSTNDVSKILVSADGERRISILPVALGLIGKAMLGWWKEYNDMLKDKDIMRRRFEHFNTMPLKWSDNEYNMELAGQEFNNRYCPEVEFQKTLRQFNRTELEQIILLHPAEFRAIAGRRISPSELRTFVSGYWTQEISAKPMPTVAVFGKMFTTDICNKGLAFQHRTKSNGIFHYEFIREALDAFIEDNADVPVEPMPIDDVSSGEFRDVFPLTNNTKTKQTKCVIMDDASSSNSMDEPNEDGSEPAPVLQRVSRK